jgi:predicted O-methyltransferase YrrM
MTTPMPIKSSITAEPVARYVVEKIVRDSELEGRLRVETRKMSSGGMISSSDVGALLAILLQSVNGKKAIEVGTFTGYTALKMAQALPKGGQLVCCDISADWTNIGRRYWDEADVTSKIKLEIAPALQTLNALIANGEQGTFDFAFIDADKTGYDSYYEACLKLLRPGGLIVLDNMLWDGDVADLEVQDDTTKALRHLNEKVSTDSRVDAVLMTVGDGLMLARKK